MLRIVKYKMSGCKHLIDKKPIKETNYLEFYVLNLYKCSMCETYSFSYKIFK